MANSNPTSPSSNSDLASFGKALGRILLLGALGLALYLGITSLINGALAGCTSGSGCDEVVSSKWGYAFGIPVSLLGAAIYVVLLGSDLKGCCARLHAICRWMIIGAALWFVCVQAFILGKYCPWCCITHTLAVFGALLLWKRSPTASQAKLAPALGFAALLGMVLVQTFGPEKATTVGGSLAEGQGNEVSAPIPDGPRTISLHGGKFNIDVQEFPAIGNAQTAKHVAVGLFDFTCPHCQRLSKILTKIQSEFGDQLAVVQLPGHFAPKGERMHKQMLAIWKEDPESYLQLATLLHEGTLKAQEIDVTAAIGSIVDTTEHAAWMTKHSDWSNQAIANSAAIRAANKALIKTGKFPQLMVGDYIEAGAKDNPGYYYDLFKEKFGITRTAIPKLVVEPTSQPPFTSLSSDPRAASEPSRQRKIPSSKGSGPKQ